MVSNSSSRMVSEMYRSSSISRKQGELLYRLVGYFSPSQVLELGTHFGLSSIYMAQNSNVQVESFEGCPETRSVALENFKSQKISNVNVTLGDFNTSVPKKLKEIASVDFAYVDGNHTYEGTLWAYDLLKNIAKEDSVLVFDDINWSLGMKRAWEEIISKPEVSLSVNCYKFGLILFRQGVEKQNVYFKF